MSENNLAKVKKWQKIGHKKCKMSENVFSDILVHLHHGNFLALETNFLTFLHLFSDISTHESMFWHFFWHLRGEIRGKKFLNKHVLIENE